MNSVKLLVIILLSLSLILLIIQNSVPVQSRFLWITVEMPVFMLLFIAVVGGFLLGMIVTIFVNKSENKKTRDKNENSVR